MHYISFFTATILEWRHLLKADSYKDIIISSMRYLVNDNRLKVFGFVIMPNHIHTLWKIHNDIKKDDLQRDFLKYTAQQMKFELLKDDPEKLKMFYVGAKDRKYQFWERNPLTSRLPSMELIMQKLNYIHANPIWEKWNLCQDVTDYKYSTAAFYYKDEKTWDFVTHLNDASLDD